MHDDMDELIRKGTQVEVPPDVEDRLRRRLMEFRTRVEQRPPASLMRAPALRLLAMAAALGTAARQGLLVREAGGMARLAELTEILPFMKSPTISPLKGGEAFAVRVAAPRSALAGLIPEIKRRGGSDIVVSELSQLVP